MNSDSDLEIDFPETLEEITWIEEVPRYPLIEEIREKEFYYEILKKFTKKKEDCVCFFKQPSTLSESFENGTEKIYIPMEVVTKNSVILGGVLDCEETFQIRTKGEMYEYEVHDDIKVLSFIFEFVMEPIKTVKKCYSDEHQKMTFFGSGFAKKVLDCANQYEFVDFCMFFDYILSSDIEKYYEYYHYRNFIRREPIRKSETSYFLFIALEKNNMVHCMEKLSSFVLKYILSEKVKQKDLLLDLEKGSLILLLFVSACEKKK